MSAVERRALPLPGGGTASYWRRGSGEPLLLLHSVLRPSDDDRFADALAGHHDVVMPLAPGYADLDELVDIEDVHDLALYYDDVLRALDLGPLPVVGLSTGGMAAAELAAHLPERVSALVLVSPFGFWDEARPTLDLSTLPATAFRQRLTRGNDSLLPAVDPDDAEARTADAVEFAQAITSTLKFAWPFPDQGLRKRLHRVACDTLLVWGEDDDVNPPSYAEDFAKGLARSRVELLDGGHLLPYEQPDRLAKLILDFIDRGK